MFVLGIRVPFRQPTWEDNNAFADLGVRHSQCNARECLYPGGREEAEEEGPWQLLLCSSCAAEGTHRRCSGLRNHIQRWECDSCAGLGTGMSQSSRCPWAGVSAQAALGRARPLLEGWGHCSGLGCLGPEGPLTFLLALTAARDEPEPSGPSLARQSGLESAHGSSESEAIRPSSRTPVAPELAFPSPSPETSSHSSHQHTAGRKQSLPSSLLDTSSPSTSGPTYSSSPDPEDRVPSRRAGPGRRRSSSRQQGRAPNRPVRSGSCCDRSSGTIPRDERLRRRETPSRTSPRQGRAPQQGWAQSPRVRSRSRRDRSSGLGPRAERPRQRETPPPASPRRSRSGQQGPAQSPPVRSRRRRDRSSMSGPRPEMPRRRETLSWESPRRSRSGQQGWAQSPPVRSRSRRDRSSISGPVPEMPRRRETPSWASPRRSRAPQQGPAQSPPVRSRSRRDRSSMSGPGPEMPRRRESASPASPRCSRSRLQRRASNQRVRSRSPQDRSRRTAASAERPRPRGTPSGTSRRSNRSPERRRTSTRTSNSST
ncbi:serine/arginine repetitive matrix protein 2-like [Motacilla alba alba]|uniref:serine/arginine repetitive matrix protein 2-like n=1 Tax=Motacilla alba alba TaxID=1094192 RepID=UPI0018D567D3|nr:serine/arginine repetitive matrix protein 2-like [Motacilla alba alba]